LFKSDGTFVAASADQTTAWNTGTGYKTAAWAGGTKSISGTFCWIGILSNGQSPKMSLRRASANTAGETNGQLAVGLSRAGTFGSAITSNTPGNVTPGSIVQVATLYTLALY
jgi:hypothetical protein